MNEKITEEITKELKLRQERANLAIPIGVSNKHIHLSKEDFKILFGADAEPTLKKPVAQPGQFACEEVVDVKGPRGIMKAIRMLGPCRSHTQLELSMSDARKLGLECPIRDSGKLENTPGMEVIGPKGTIVCKDGAIIAKRHIHFSPEDAEKFKVKDGEDVRVLCGKGGERETIFEKVLCRVSKNFVLEMHVDVEEANAACLKNGDKVCIL